jgi:hypothetical protein
MQNFQMPPMPLPYWRVLAAAKVQQTINQKTKGLFLYWMEQAFFTS